MSKMPHARKWKHALGGTYGEEEARAIVARAQSFYDVLCAWHLPDANGRDRTVLRTRVLPGLAIYKALLEGTGNKERALADAEVLFRAAFFTGLARGIRLLNRLPDPFPIVRPALKLMTRDEYLPGSQEVVEDSGDCYALKIHRCLILDTLREDHAGELTPLFCATDDWLAALLPKIHWERTQTLGRGGDCCDPCWRRSRSLVTNRT
jgi:hypothetical protein